MDNNNLTKKELLVICEQLGIVRCKSKTKSELVSLIQQKQPEPIEIQTSTITNNNVVMDI
jgi:hypothetical protein